MIIQELILVKMKLEMVILLMVNSMSLFQTVAPKLLNTILLMNIQAI